MKSWHCRDVQRWQCELAVEGFVVIVVQLVALLGLLVVQLAWQAQLPVRRDLGLLVAAVVVVVARLTP